MLTLKSPGQTPKSNECSPRASRTPLRPLLVWGDWKSPVALVDSGEHLVEEHMLYIHKHLSGKEFLLASLGRAPGLQGGHVWTHNTLLSQLLPSSGLQPALE